MAGGGDGLLDFAALHDRQQEADCDDLKHHVDEGQEKRHSSNVLEGLPRICVLQRLARPNISHDEHPKSVHHDRHYA